MRAFNLLLFELKSIRKLFLLKLFIVIFIIKYIFYLLPPLILAVDSGNEKAVDTLIYLGADINGADVIGATPLHLAVDQGNSNMIKYLLKKGADVNTYNDEGITPLLVASNSGKTTIIKTLLEAGANPNSMKYGVTPLLYVAQSNNYEAIRLLINFGADINIADKAEGITPLMLMVEKENIDIVKLLIHNGVKINMQNRDGYTALLLAISSKNREIIELLLNNGANPNIKNKDGNTPLLMATVQENKESVKLLIDKGADVNMKGLKDFTALYVASVQNSTEIINILLNEGADVNMKNSQGVTPFMVLVKTRNAKFIEELITKGADVNLKDQDENTPLLYAAKYAEPDVVKLLINHSNDINVKNRTDGDTPLMRLSKRKENELVNLLIKKGANINIKNNSGITPAYYISRLDKKTATIIMEKSERGNLNAHDTQNKQTTLINAAYEENIDSVRLLLEKGADVNAKDFIGYTPIFYAVTNNRTDIMKLLINKGADVNVKANYEELTKEASSQRKGILAALRKRNISLRMIGNLKTTPLMTAAFLGKSEAVKLLLDSGADANVKDEYGHNALFYSLESKRLRSKKIRDVKTVKLLLEHNSDENLTLPSDSYDKSMLITLIRDGNTELAKLFIEYKVVDINAENANHYTVLNIAIDKNNLELVKLLLKNGADVNLNMDRGFTALGHAIQKNNLEIVSLIYDAGGKTGFRDDSVIMYAIRFGSYDAINLFINKGSDINALNKYDENALMLAASFGYEEIMNLLISKGAKVTDEYTALVIAILKDDLESVKLYSKNRQALIDYSLNGRSALVRAITANKLEAVKILIDAGADLNYIDERDLNPLIYAFWGKNEKMIKLLKKHGARELR